MFAGIDFPSFFETDNFASRRTIVHNMYDPESLISGKEIMEGMTYTNSKRQWSHETHYKAAVVGYLTPDQILRTAPRVRIPSYFW